MNRLIEDAIGAYPALRREAADATCNGDPLSGFLLRVLRPNPRQPMAGPGRGTAVDKLRDAVMVLEDVADAIEVGG